MVLGNHSDGSRVREDDRIFSPDSSARTRAFLFPLCSSNFGWTPAFPDCVKTQIAIRVDAMLSVSKQKFEKHQTYVRQIRSASELFFGHHEFSHSLESRGRISINCECAKPFDGKRDQSVVPTQKIGCHLRASSCAQLAQYPQIVLANAHYGPGKKFRHPRERGDPLE